jgi:hypothetical protein
VGVFLRKHAPFCDPIVDLPDGIGTRPVVARDGKEAFEIGRRHFNEY